MTWSLWFILLIMKYFCLFSLNSLILGLFIFGCSLSVSMLMSMYSLSWYSLMFFLVYVGGLLVLFMYISSLKFNPVFMLSNYTRGLSILLKINLIFFLVVSMTQITWNFKGRTWKTKNKKYSLNLFNETEVFFLISVGIMLLMVLWVMTKMSFQNRSALRPFYSWIKSTQSALNCSFEGVMKMNNLILDF